MKDRIVEEICKCGDLDKYRREVEITNVLAHQYGFNVVTRSDLPQSSTDWTNKYIRLALGTGVPKGLPIMWDLLHEIGHVLDGNPSHSLPPEKQYLREKRAWANAWSVVKKHLPILTRFSEQFNKHRDECLDTYRNYLEASKQTKNSPP